MISLFDVMGLIHMNGSYPFTNVTPGETHLQFMRGVEWRAKYKCPIIRFITKSNKSVQHQFTTITSKEVAPGIKFHGLILMSSRLINFTSDLHGSLKIYWEQTTYVIIWLIVLFVTNETAHSFPHCKSSKVEIKHESRSIFYDFA